MSISFTELEATVTNEAIYEVISKYFDVEFYLNLYPDVKAEAEKGLDPIQHFIDYGWKEFRNPNSAFDTRAFFLQNPLYFSNNICAYYYYLISPVPTQTNPKRRTNAHSQFLLNMQGTTLFDKIYYASKYSDVIIGAEEEHYNTIGGNEKRSPNPLFDVEFYLSQLSMTEKEEALPNPFSHYLSIGWTKSYSPHQLFDVDYYASLHAEEFEISHLEHFLNSGWKAGHSSHPLFQSEYYKSQQALGKSECPIIHYLLHAPENAQPNYLFNDMDFRLQLKTKFGEGVELADFVSNRKNFNISTHPYFSPAYYLDQLKTLSKEKEDDERLEVKTNPLQHYLSTGYLFNLKCSRLFHPAYFQKSLELEGDEDLLYHFLVEKKYKFNSGHPAFNLEYYKKQSTDYNDELETAVMHFLSAKKSKRISYHSLFDEQYYLNNNSDVKDSNICPKEHFLMFGFEESRRPNALMSEQYILNKHSNISFAHSSMVQKYLEEGTEQKIRVYFTSHDASRTGAPAIILRLVQDFSKLDHVECTTILDRGGPLVEDFSAVSHVHVLDKSVYQIGPNNDIHRSEIQDIFNLHADSTPIASICNSMETRHLSTYFSELGIPVISLVHEIPDYFPKSEFDIVYKASKSVIYPSNFIGNRAKLKTAKKYQNKWKVKGQGLLKDHFGRLNKNSARDSIIKEFNLPNDAFIVLGCGTLDLRKGIDYFTNTAYNVIRRAKEYNRPIRFIWLGDGEKHAVSPFTLIGEVNKRLGFERHIQFVGSRKNVEPYFVGSDLFLMTSRADPFPCVIHEAMASGLPVICFNEGGGAAELVKDNGFSVPLGDIVLMADKIISLANDEKLLKKLSKQAQEEITTNWKSTDYFNYMLNEIDQITNINLKQQIQSNTSDELKNPVYFLSPDWGISGVNTLAVSTIKGLRKQGINAQILFTRGRFSHIHTINDKELLPDVPYTFLQPKDKNPESIWESFSEWMDNSEPAVIIPNYDYVASSVSPITPSHIGIVGIAHSDHIEHYEHVYRLGHYWQKIIAVSNQVKNEIVKLNSAFKDKTEVIYNGVCLDDIPIAKKRDLKTPLRLVYSGRMVIEQKRVHRYIELADELEKRGFDFELTMLGDGQELEAIRNASVKFGDKVRLLGIVEHDVILEELARADIFVLLSDYEGLPISLLEAMALGCVPVVYDMKSGIPEVLETNLDSIIINSCTISETADEIIKLGSEPETLNRISQQTRKSLVEKGLNTDDMADKYQETILKVFEEINSKDGVQRTESFSWASNSKILPPPNLYNFI